MGKGGRGRGRGRGGGDPIAGIVGWLAKHLGACVSVQRSEEGDVLRTKNDYELVVRASKELEHVLEEQLGARGKGLHEKATSVQHLLSKDLVRKIRYLATIRNKLVHEADFNEIPDRARFVNDFVGARREMRAVLARHGRAGAGQQGDICAVM